jgi:hypothetical protein
MKEVQDIARVLAMLLGQINLAERHHRFRRWNMYKRGEIKMLLFSDGQHHQAQVCGVWGKAEMYFCIHFRKNTNTYGTHTYKN